MNAAIAGRLAPLTTCWWSPPTPIRRRPRCPGDDSTNSAPTAPGPSTSRLDGLGGLRPGLDAAAAAAIADLLIDPMPYRRLVVQHGWTFEAYAEHLQRIAAASLLR